MFDGCGESDSLWEHVQVNYPDLNDDKAYHWIDAAELLEWLENALTEDVIPGSESDDWPAVLDTVRHRIEKAKIDLVYFGD